MARRGGQMSRRYESLIRSEDPREWGPSAAIYYLRTRRRMRHDKAGVLVDRLVKRYKVTKFPWRRKSPEQSVDFAVNYYWIRQRETE